MVSSSFEKDLGREFPGVMRRDILKGEKQKLRSQKGAFYLSSLKRIDGLTPYLRSFYQRASDTLGIHGRVFIVGGTEHEALACLALGAEDVVVANPWFAAPWYQENLQGFENPHVRLCGSFAEDVEIKAGCIDVVLSACVIEHILNIPSVLDKIAESLKPGGRALIYGGPVWTGPQGHHLWTVAEDGTRYFFNGSGDEQPVNEWEHLIFSPAEFHERLVERGVPPGHVKAIVEHIFFSKNLNRLSPSEIEEMIADSELHCLSFQRVFCKAPGKRTVKALFNRFSIEDLSTWAVDFSLEKMHENAQERRTQVEKLVASITEDDETAPTVQPRYSTKDIKALEADLEDLRKANTRLAIQLGELYESRSWRITAPLRSAARFLKRWFARNPPLRS